MIKVSFNKETFSDFRKVANFIPIHKKGEKLDLIITDPSLYYPI